MLDIKMNMRRNVHAAKITSKHKTIVIKSIFPLKKNNKKVHNFVYSFCHFGYNATPAFDATILSQEN